MAENGNVLCFLFALLLLCLPVSHCFVAVAVEGYGRGRLIRSTDSGVSWTTLVESYIDLHAVVTPSPYSVVAVGDNGTIITAAINVTLPTTLTTLYSNTSVDDSSYLSSSLPTYSSYYPGSYSSLVSQYASLAVQSGPSAEPVSLNGSVSQYYASMASAPHDTAWTPTSLTYVYATVSPIPADDFRAVTFVSPLLGVAVGTTGMVYRSADGGWTWSSVASGIIRDLNALAFALSSSAGWTLMAAGNVGTVLLSRDTGLSWQPLNLSTVGNLYAIALYSTSQAVVCGDAGTLLTTRNGGSVWSDLSQPQWSNFSFYSVAYHNASTLFITAGRSALLVSNDGGNTLSRVSLPLNNQLIRFGALFLTPTVLTVAARNRVYAAYLASSSSSSSSSSNTSDVASGTWSPLTAVNINAISSVAILEAGVLTVAVPSFNLSAYLGSDLSFNVTITNTGTESLTVTNFTSDDALITFAPDKASATVTFPLTLTTNSDKVVLDFVYKASQLPDTSITAYYTNLTLLTNTPTQRTRVYFSLYLLPLPSSSSPSFLSQYWYVLALALGAVSVLLIIFVRRRLRYVRRWNRRVLYEDEKIQFWGCWLLSQDIEHDSDSEFWSDESDQDEADGDEEDDEQRTDEEGGEGEEEEEGEEGLDEEGEEYGGTDVRDQYWDGSLSEHKEARHGKPTKQARHRLVWRDDEDDGWDDDDDDEARADLQEGGDEADEEDTDSSISDQDYQDGDYLRHRGAAGRGTVTEDNRRQSHYPSGSVDSTATMHGRRSSVLPVMADVARMAAAARHHR